MSATQYSITVLLHNAKRQIVKVSKHTSIGQVLEIVCEKQELNSNEYNLKRNNKILNLSSSLYFDGIPNNALLELEKAEKIRVETSVSLVMQLESGERLLDTFSPSTTLWSVLMHWQNKSHSVIPEKDGEILAVCIYMRREIVGEETLKETTLRSLGLNSGSAVVRLIHRTAHSLRTQANVSAPLANKQTERLRNEENSTETSANIPTVTDDKNTEPVTSHEEKSSTSANECKESDMEVEQEVDVIKTENSSDKVPVIEEPDNQPEEKIIILGDRNAICFSRGSYSNSQTEVNESFYKLTVNDVAYLQNELTRKRIELEEARLLTKRLREVEKIKEQSDILQRYTSTVVRILFPDNIVLQGTFLSEETVQCVLDFVKSHLDDNRLQFELFTAPPKVVLSGNSRLVDVRCVPAVLVHFHCETTSEHYLNSKALANLSYLRIRKPKGGTGKTSQDPPSQERHHHNKPTTSKSKSTMPKWFKPQ